MIDPAAQQRRHNGGKGFAFLKGSQLQQTQQI